MLENWSVRYLASRAFVPTNARNRHPALPPDVCFSACWGSTPNPLNSPVAGAGCAFGSRTLLSLRSRDRQGLRPLESRRNGRRSLAGKGKNEAGLHLCPLSDSGKTGKGLPGQFPNLVQAFLQILNVRRIDAPGFVRPFSVLVQIIRASLEHGNKLAHIP